MACISSNIGTSVGIFESHHHRSLRSFVSFHRQCIFGNSVFFVRPLRSNSVFRHGPLKHPLSNGYQSFSAAFNSIASDNGMPEERVAVLVIGGGGREHAICYALKRSPSCDAIFCAPGNAGISSAGDATCISDLDILDSSL